MTELLKAQTNRGIKPTLHFLRDKQGHEIDVLIETGPDTFQAVEIKSGGSSTAAPLVKTGRKPPFSHGMTSLLSSGILDEGPFFH